MDKNWERLYKLKIGECFIPDSNTLIVRVPGGWVYSSVNGCCFIPFIEEK